MVSSMFNRKIRMQSRLSQEQLAIVLKVSNPTVNRWENGKANSSQIVWQTLNVF